MNDKKDTERKPSGLMETLKNDPNVNPTLFSSFGIIAPEGNMFEISNEGDHEITTTSQPTEITFLVCNDSKLYATLDVEGFEAGNPKLVVLETNTIDIDIENPIVILHWLGNTETYNGGHFDDPYVNFIADGKDLNEMVQREIINKDGVKETIFYPEALENLKGKDVEEWVKAIKLNDVDTIDNLTIIMNYNDYVMYLMSHSDEAGVIVSNNHYKNVDWEDNVLFVYLTPMDGLYVYRKDGVKHYLRDEFYKIQKFINVSHGKFWEFNISCGSKIYLDYLAKDDITIIMSEDKAKLSVIHYGINKEFTFDTFLNDNCIEDNVMSLNLFNLHKDLIIDKEI